MLATWSLSSAGIRSGERRLVLCRLRTVPVRLMTMWLWKGSIGLSSTVEGVDLVGLPLSVRMMVPWRLMEFQRPPSEALLLTDTALLGPMDLCGEILFLLLRETRPLVVPSWSRFSVNFRISESVESVDESLNLFERRVGEALTGDCLCGSP